MRGCKRRKILHAAFVVLAFVAAWALFTTRNLELDIAILHELVPVLHRSQVNGRQPIWLVAIISAAPAQRRRNIIRATMQQAYTDPLVEFRFVISDPTDTWMPLIEHENRSYGDIIMLSHLEESPKIANTIKFVEFLLHTTSTGENAARDLPPLPAWQFVSKVDDDSFVAIPAFYQRYLLPLLEARGDAIARPDLDVLIGRKLQARWPRPYNYPGGQFYTVSRKTAETVVRQYTQHPITDEPEDVLIGRLLHEAGQKIEINELTNPVAFDFDNDIRDPWAWSHNISGFQALNPHKMKDDELYLRVAREMLKWHPDWGH
jgi:hypothetical protein